MRQVPTILQICAIIQKLFGVPFLFLRSRHQYINQLSKTLATSAVVANSKGCLLIPGVVANTTSELVVTNTRSGCEPRVFANITGV